MTTTKEAPVEPAAEGSTEAEHEATARRGVISNWEFMKQAPTQEKVLELLEGLPPVHGINHIDYADFVQALPAKKKIQVPHPTNPKVKVDEYLENWTLYMSVAGRQAMMNAAAELNNWRVEIEPEPNSPVGAPGFISLEQRIVYREYIKIWQYDEDGDALYKGVRNGMAWVPFSGGSQAAGSNPYEKVETAARGRALGAWGFGVFPGSGIASLEEMLGIDQNREAIQQERAATGAPAHPTRKPREQLLEDTFTAIEKLRMTTSDTDLGMVQKVGLYLSKTLGATSVYDEASSVIQWDLVKDGHLVMVTNFLQKKNEEILAARI